MPPEITTSEPTATPGATSGTKVVSFKLEKIDNDNVRKIDSHPDVSIINIPTLQKEKNEIEAMIGKLQAQLDKINEVLAERAKLP